MQTKYSEITKYREISRRDFLCRLGITSAGLTALGAAANAANADTEAFAQSEEARHAAPALKQSLSSQPIPSQSGATNPGAAAPRIHINQAGYLPAEPKRAVIAAMGPIPDNSFCLVDDDVTRRVRFRGMLREYQSPRATPYGHYARHYDADFTNFTETGRYQLRLPDGRMSAPFSIRKDIYAQLLPLTLEFFAVQSCGKIGGTAANCCHRDDGVALGGPRDKMPIDASGGWHDAGDYLKFVETASYVTALMLFAADQFPALAPKRPAALGMPPLLAQARVGVEWLLKMHPTPHEFYYQVGDGRDHETWRLPDQDRPENDKDWTPRTVRFGVGANLAGRTAAALALAYRLYAHYDTALAARCLATAESAYRLGKAHPAVVTTEPRDFYPESTWEDDMAWGAGTLYRVTGKPGYLQEGLEFAHRAGAAGDQTSVYNTHALAHYTLYPYVQEKDRDRLRSYLRADADLARERAGNPYGLATPYIWGTAEAAAGAALNCLLYARRNEIGDNRPYLDVARYNRDFILGCNPFGTSYLIGAGTRYPLYPHHQWANLKHEELRGALVGGPTSADEFRDQNITFTEKQDQMITGPSPADDLPDQVAVYHDAVQDYVTNEPAIDYTAKFLLLAAFYHHESNI